MLEFYEKYFKYLSELDGKRAEWEKLIDKHMRDNAVDILDKDYILEKERNPLITNKSVYLDEILGDKPQNKREAMSRWKKKGFPEYLVPNLMDAELGREEKAKLYYSLVYSDLSEQQKFHEVFCALEIGELVVKSKLYDVIRMAIKTNIKKGSVEEVGYEEFLRNFKDSISSAISVGLIDYNSELDWCDSTDEELEVGLEEENSPEPLEAFTPKFFKKKIENGELDI